MTWLSPLALAALERARAEIAAIQPTSQAKATRHWSDDQTRILMQLYPDTPMPELIRQLGFSASAIYQKARALGVRRSEQYLASEHACRLRRDNNPGVATRFKPGHASWNAGKKGWHAGGRAPETQFKPGHKPHTWVPIGTEQIRDGYLWRKVTDGNGRHDWRQVHVMLWEQRHGPIPSGLILVFKDRNRQNIQLDNLELITRAENCRRNSIQRYPPELKQAIRKLAKLKKTIEGKANEQPT